MGNWQLEVYKMTLYLAFPVGLFHMFNQPAYFEDWVVETKRRCFPAENKEDKEALEKLKADMRKKRNEEMMAEIEAEKMKMKYL